MFQKIDTWIGNNFKKAVAIAVILALLTGYIYHDYTNYQNVGEIYLSKNGAAARTPYIFNNYNHRYNLSCLKKETPDNITVKPNTHTSDAYGGNWTGHTLMLTEDGNMTFNVDQCDNRIYTIQELWRDS